MCIIRPLLALLPAFLLAAPPIASSRSAVFFFGQAGADHARQSAKSATAAAKRWLNVAGSTAELRRAGTLDARAIGGAEDKDLEAAFARVAREAADTDPAALAPSLEAAAQSLAQSPGVRLLIAVVENPPASLQLDTAIQPIVELCQANQIWVLVLDPAEANGKDSNPALVNLAKSTGGLLIRNPKFLDQSIVTLSASAAAAPVEAVAPAAPMTSAVLPKDLNVTVRFVRSSAQGFQTYGVERGTVTGGTGGVSVAEGGSNVVSTSGPMRGLLFVESPLSGLKFETNQASKTYYAHVRITQIARNAKGVVAWRASKELTIRGPLSNLEARLAGNLYYMRQLQLPGSHYTIEATVEDLLANKTGSVQEKVQPGQGLPGFYVSDALFVRPFDGKSDKFEADSILEYDGNALSPILNPVFQAGGPFNLNLYFVMYPDINGGQPDVSLEILNNGRVVGRAALPFTDSLRDTTRDGIGASKGEQKRQFPYLATLRGAQLGPGEYEARVSIRQNRNVLVRSVPFRVLGRGETVAVVTSGPAASPAPQAEDDAAAFVMPEVDPVKLRTTGPQLAPEELERLCARAERLIRENGIT